MPRPRAKALDESPDSHPEPSRGTEPGVQRPRADALGAEAVDAKVLQGFDPRAEETADQRAKEATNPWAGDGADGTDEDGPDAWADEATEGVTDLSFRQARTALDLTLAELQASDLEVETMATLYRRAQLYADRCEAVLRQVEQDVMQWDPQDPTADPTPLPP